MSGEEYVLTDGDHAPEVLKPDATASEAAEWGIRHASKSFSFICTHCGHRISFNAGFLALFLHERRSKA